MRELEELQKNTVKDTTPVSEWDISVQPASNCKRIQLFGIAVPLHIR